jgi:anaerobic carbon-monoxide dehydrogenase iron sulfur subunit
MRAKIKMAKSIVIQYEKCVGCRTCEMVCSLGHENEISPFRSRIRVIKWEETAHSIPVNCRQCEDAPCQKVCPVQAIVRDEGQGLQVIDYDKCIGCRSCVLVCPFGAIAFNSTLKKVVKCDLCDGDPLCVKFCAYGTLVYIETDEINQDKMTTAAEKILAAQKNAEKIES